MNNVLSPVRDRLLRHARHLSLASLGLLVVWTGLAVPAQAGWPGGPPQPNGRNRPPYAHGPQDGDPVDLAVGTETHTAPPDIVVYNPNGPDVAYQRSFDSARAGDGYASPGLSPGWCDIYDVTVQGPSSPGTWGPLVLVWQNGTAETITPVTDYSGQPTGDMPPVAGAPYMVHGAASTTMGRWNSFTLTYKDQTQWTFTPRADDPTTYVLTGITDRMGHSVSVDRDPANNYRLRSVIGSSTLLSFAYDTAGHLSSVTDSYGRQVTYTFGTAAGTGLGTLCLLNVSQVTGTGVSNPPSRYTYGYVARNSQPYLSSVGIPSPTGTGTSNVVGISYDTSGKVTSQTDGDGNRHIYTYNYQDPTSGKYGTRVDVNNASGRTVSWWVKLWSNDGFNVQNGVMDANGHYSVVKYDDPSNPSQPTSIQDDPNHPATTFSYDQFGNVTSATTPRGTTILYNYDYTAFPMGRLSGVQEGSKPETFFTYYEPSGLLQKITRPAPYGSGYTSVDTLFEYDSLGNVTKVTSPGTNGATVVTTYNYTTDGATTRADMKGLPLLAVRSGGADALTTHFRYDTRGNLTSFTNAAGFTTDLTYNLADRPWQVTYPATGQTGSGREYVTYNYLYPNGNPLYAYGPLASVSLYDESNALARQVSYAYDGQGLLLSVGGNTEPATYTYDALYRVTKVQDGKGNPTSYTYNTAGYLTTVQYPDTQQVQYTYNTDTTLHQRIDGNGTRTYLYDASIALSDIQYSADATKNVHFGWDDYDRILTMTDGAGETDYTYGDRDEVESVTTTYTGLSTPQTVSYGYWENGRRHSMTTPAGAFTYTYDGIGRPHTLTNPFNEVSSWTYQNGHLATQTLGNQAYTTYSWDSLGRLAQLQNITSGASLLSSFTGVNGGGIGYDAAGNPLKVQVNIPSSSTLSGTTNYTYDTKDQLKEEQSGRNGGYDLFFDYDLAGNTTTYPHGSGSQTGISYNVDNQRTGPETFVYDAAGNPTTDRNYAGFVYDPANHFAQLPGAVTSGYKGSGLRAWKQTSAGKTYYIYDGYFPVYEINAATGAVSAVNTFGPNGLLSRNANSASTFYTFDRQGSVAQRLGASQNVLSTDLYDAYGRRLAGGYGSDPYGYAARWGGYTDLEMGLVLMGFRHYDPAEGRFLTRDPSGYWGGMNLYGYVGNNPVAFMDPLGLDWVNNTSDFVSGWGDTLSGGWTRTIRQHLGVDDVVNYCSPWYNAGQDVGTVHNAALILAGDDAAAEPEGLASEPETPTQSPEPPGDGCFVAGTPVTMGDGTTKPIEQVKAGDVVASRDPHTGAIVARPVKRTLTHQKDHTVVLTFSTSERIETTEEHPFYVEDRGFVPAGELGIGTSIVTRAGPAVTVEKIERKPGQVTVYNFEVEDTHTYFVGSANGGVWVHNDCGDPPPNMSPDGAGRRGAFREAKRNNDIPVSQQPDRVGPNYDRRGGIQPGRTYEFDMPNGETKTIRDDAGGHDYGENDPQNRGPHFNDDAGNHYDY